MKLNSFISKKSISFTLTVASIGIFLGAISLFNFMINAYQKYLIEDMAKTLQVELNGVEESSATLIIMDHLVIRGSLEFRLYSLLISIFISLVSVWLIYMIISKLLAPLKELSIKVSGIDIDNLRYEKGEIISSNGSKEMRELSNVLNKTFLKIYESYQREKEFSINLAHEIRTPLAVLSTKIEVFMKKNPDIDEDMKEFINGLQSNIFRLSKLSEGVMLLNTNGEFIKTEVCVNSVIEELIFDFEDFEREKNIKFSQTGEEVIINTDEGLFIRLIYNLIENAIKYNVEGGRIDIDIKDEGDFIIIEIADTGKGIKCEDKTKVFDLFYRADNSRNSHIGGYGIGLYLVFGIVKRLGGKISLRDNLPCGSIFRLELKK